MIQRVVIAGGGTGGHLFPGIAVLEELRRRDPEVEVCFVGTARGIEARVVPEMGEPLELVDVAPLKGTTYAGLLASLMKLPGAWGRCLSILRERRPDVVLGVGGYASGPMLMAAATLGIPCAVLEQNAHVGLTNRLLAKIVGRAYLTFRETAEVFGDRARIVGNPVRRAFLDAAHIALSDPDGFEARARKVLVIGGSQGAKALNEAVPAALAAAGLAERGIEVLHQTGAAMQAEVEARYRELGLRAEVTPFVSDMARAYAEAQLVIARAGATTLAEIQAIGRPSVLVPYPHAADDHQTRNARALEASGAAICAPQSELTTEGLARTVGELLSAPEKRRAMAIAARRGGRPDAAQAIVDDLIAWVGGKPMTGLPLRASEPPKRGGGMQFATVELGTARGELVVRRSSRPPAPPVRIEVVPAAVPRLVS